MIFSDKIFKIISGDNVSLYATSSEDIYLYLYNKLTKKYKILINSNRNCVFCDNYNAQKVIELGNDILAIGSNDFITIMDKNDL